VAKSKIPRPLDRRHLLQREMPAAKMLEIGEAYLAESRQVEAIDFFKKAGATEQLESMLEQATETGDSFLVRIVAAALRVTPTRERWLRVAAAADAQGKQLYAVAARRQAEIDQG